MIVEANVVFVVVVGCCSVSLTRELHDGEVCTRRALERYGSTTMMLLWDCMLPASSDNVRHGAALASRGTCPGSG